MSPEDPQWPRAADWLASGGDPHGPSLAVLGVPLSRTSLSASGAHETPAAVRAALRRYSTYSAELDVDLESLSVVDHGDLSVAGLDGPAALAEIAARVAELPRADLLVTLGGDNALTRPVLVGLAGGDLGRVGLLTLDAHHDVRSFYAGPTNGNPVRGLVEDGLAARHVVQIGLGDFSNSRAYRRWCADRGITVVTAGQARADGVGACVRRHLHRLAAGCDWVYVDLDVDVLDSAFAPGCPGARPGGLMPHELLDAAREAGRHAAVRAVDIVEVDATADLGGRTVDTAALCLLAAAAGVASRRGPAMI